MSVRETLERTAKLLDSVMIQTGRPDHWRESDKLQPLVARSLTQLDEMERDHEAMGALRFASLKRGWKWHWDGMDLEQRATMPTDTGVYKDPADAILGTQEGTT